MKNELDLEIYDIWYTPFYQTKLFFVICSLIVFFIFAFLFFIFKKKKKLSKKRNITIDDLINNLYQLSSRIDILENKEVYSEIIQILKHFVFMNYGCNLFSKTDKELIVFFESKSMYKECNEKIKNLIDNALLTKFANDSVTKIQMQEDLESSINLVKIAKTFSEGIEKTT